MRIAVLGNEKTKSLFSEKRIPAGVEILWCGSVKTLVATEAEVYFDFLFENDKERFQVYSMRKGFPFFVNCVELSSSAIPAYLIRFNGWPGFFDRTLIEIAKTDEQQTKVVAAIFQKLEWKYKEVADLPGLVSARIVAAIINEAYFTVGDEISTKEEIDIAMRLGTNYPFGPFEWAEKIGISKVYSLLVEMNKNDELLSIAPALKDAALKVEN